MAKLTEEQLSTVRSKLTRAESRFNGAAKAASRANIEEGEFDNNFDGIVTGIFHVVDAFELARTGLHRNTSVHGQWVEILDRDALEDAVKAGRHSWQPLTSIFGATISQSEWPAQHYHEAYFSNYIEGTEFTIDDAMRRVPAISCRAP